MDVTAALAEVRRRIASTGRAVDDVAIVAVTKGFDATAVEAAARAGLADVGENYAQSMLDKVAALDGDGANVRWHFLGPVQRNKVKALAPHVALWHGVDRHAAADEIARRAPSAPVLVQVNLTGDATRSGVSWDDAAALVERLRTEVDVDLRGLMGVAAPDVDEARTQFRRLAALAADLGLTELSMGMSGDLEVAVEEGATLVRVGTALFGARPGVPQVRR
jgi:pyridoxal phosphate enzyme (YggS family)